MSLSFVCFSFFPSSQSLLLKNDFSFHEILRGKRKNALQKGLYFMGESIWGENVFDEEKANIEWRIHKDSLWPKMYRFKWRPYVAALKSNLEKKFMLRNLKMLMRIREQICARFFYLFLWILCCERPWCWFGMKIAILLHGMISKTWNLINYSIGTKKLLRFKFLSIGFGNFSF